MASERFEKIVRERCDGRTVTGIEFPEPGGVRLYFGGGEWVEFKGREFEGLPVLSFAYPDQTTIDVGESG